jgi:ATP-dependent RNA helicase RhlE
LLRKKKTYMTGFSGLNLAQPILRALETEGYSEPTPIQAQSIPALLEGKDLLGIAQTGTGKTAAFALPLIDRLSSNRAWARPNAPRAVILAPTRELAGQIGDSLRTYGKHVKLRSTVVFGGVSIRPQIRAVQKGVHILVATPGRLMDLVRQGHIDFSDVQTFILDEADRMLDMGFIGDVKKVAAAMPADRQTVLFSATMPKEIAGLASSLLTEPVRVEVTPEATTVQRIDQRVLFVSKENKRALLTDLLSDETISRVLVFTRTKHGADKVVRNLEQAGIAADAIHGNKAQNARQRALKGFRDGKIRALVATDIAARGIDVDGISHVINYELPNDPSSYVHRIGRTARAGADGTAIAFCDREETAYLRDIQKTIREELAVDDSHPFHDQSIAVDSVRRPQKPAQPKRFKRFKQGGGGKPGAGRRDGKPVSRRTRAHAA